MRLIPVSLGVVAALQIVAAAAAYPVLTLAVSPLRWLTGWQAVIRVRRMLGDVHVSKRSDGFSNAYHPRRYLDARGTRVCELLWPADVGSLIALIRLW